MNNIWLEQKQKVSASSDEIIRQFGFDRESIIKIEELVDNHKVFKWLDIYAGIDLLLKTPTGLVGIASRIQLTRPEYYHNPQNSFTIRCEVESGNETEIDKRQNAIINQSMRPTYTMQSYMQIENPQAFLSGALVKTDDLFDFISKYPEMVGGNNSPNNKFRFVRWSDLLDKGYPVKIVIPAK